MSRREEIADVALDNAAPVLEFTESALELVPISGLALIAKGSKIIVDRVKDVRANNDARDAYISKAKALDAALMEIVKKASTAVNSSCGDERVKKTLVDGIAQSEELQLRLQTLSSTIVKLRERTKELKGGDGVIGFLKGSLFASRNEAILSDMKDAMTDAVQMFKLRGQISIENVLSDIVHYAKEIRHALKESEEQKVIDSISWAPAGYRSVDELNSEFMDGTREELFDELDAWSNGRFPQDDPRRFYVLTGGAVLGKSSIAHQFCTRLVVEGDVRYYLEDTIPRIPQYGAFIRDNPDVLERLIIRAGGVFIYAHIAVRFLDSYRDHPEEQFELLLTAGGAGLSPLDALYLQVLRSAFPPEDLRASNPRQERLRSLLTSIVLQRYPLASGAMALLGHELSENDVVAMVDRLRSVLLIDHYGRVVPLHATFGEFLLDDRRCNDPLYHVDWSKGNGRLASGCLTTLVSFRTLSGCLEAGPDSHVGRYVLYATGCWDNHLEVAEFSGGLAKQLCAMIQMIPTNIGVYTNRYSESGVTQKMAQFLEPHMGIAKANEICLEYAKSVAYSRQWWTQKRERPDTIPTVSPDDVRAIMKVHWKPTDDSGVDLSIQSGDIERYQAAHEALAREIEDAGLAELWYKNDERRVNYRPDF
ncbi:uncharacterized protein PHACADRAFT_200993 [Phanerochaete carnosa HHB-10118-sp]|uniref:Uncharacterized protein n=1 Tax=Phanerochaete carnosa (strain HHB-10118-sp) TaxID=650164 RepID=K5VU90_PHACS|nr:uncharacterized protein PHACADRAFT_200993 [Phanerochaete carnosa HHB-10118-sp]EKM50149.1 hypothetical protein PHACADRAFT_200993 [Phanerochaete carnosa HHB-10118-sp]